MPVAPLENGLFYHLSKIYSQTIHILEEDMVSIEG